jgi:hypothetical protein
MRKSAHLLQVTGFWLLLLIVVTCASDDLNKYLKDISFDMEKYKKQMAADLTKNTCMHEKSQVRRIETFKEFEAVAKPSNSKQPPFLVVILDIEKTNLACELLEWLFPKVGDGPIHGLKKDQIILIDQMKAGDWKSKVGFSSERLPKLYVLSQQIVIPYNHLFVKDEVITFISRIKQVTSIEDFVISNIGHIEKALKDERTIKNIIFIYKDEAEDEETDKKEMILAYMMNSLTSTFAMSRLVTSRKVADQLMQKVNAAMKLSLSVPDDMTLLNLACGTTQYVSIEKIAQTHKDLNLVQLLNFAANTPSLELDKVIAGLAGSGNRTENDPAPGVKTFTIAINLSDPSQEIHKMVNSILRGLYCDFRDNVKLTWVDAYFNPARVAMMGHNPGSPLPMASFVDFGAKKPSPFPTNIKISLETIRTFISDSIKLSHSDFLIKYYEVNKELLSKRKIISEYKGLKDLEDPTEKGVIRSNPFRVELYLGSSLQSNHIRRMLRHFAHTKKRLELLRSTAPAEVLPALKSLAFGVSITDQNTLSLKILQKTELKTINLDKDTYNAEKLLSVVAGVFGLPLDEYSHVPEDKLEAYLSQKQDSSSDQIPAEIYLYQDL